MAYRAFLALWAGFVVGALCAFWPTWPFTMDALLGYGVLASLSDEHAALLTMAVFGLGGIAMAYALTVIGYRRLASRFYLMPQAISEERGLIARRVSRVELAHIRTVDVRQSVLDRVLGIGSIHFASAGTGADDVTWDSVLDPVATQRAVLQRLRQTEGD
ncbi:PH domain-containing protein [Thiohalospira halophila]|uniref:PH domain-containing protein n=1 Tax=Thiohalospira halophila TaxID=381300 RepID=UPI00135630F2|nr:PH domain-containing protein [Thiohalospira halophila]